MFILNGQSHGCATQLIGDVDVEFRILFENSIDGVVISVLAGVHELIVDVDLLDSGGRDDAWRLVPLSTDPVLSTVGVHLLVEIHSPAARSRSRRWRSCCAFTHISLSACSKASSLN